MTDRATAWRENDEKQERTREETDHLLRVMPNDPPTCGRCGVPVDYAAFICADCRWKETQQRYWDWIVSLEADPEQAHVGELIRHLMERVTALEEAAR